MTTDTSEKGLETLIVAALTGQAKEAPVEKDVASETLAPFGGAGYVQGDPKDYDRDHAVDFPKLLAFLRATQSKVVQLVDRYLDGADRDQLDPLLDSCVATYVDTLDEDGQVDFKGKAKAFVRTYGFLASVLPFSNAEWEKLSIFLNFLIPKLPAPKEEDLSKGILETIDMDSYRVEVRSAIAIELADQDAEIEPVPTSGGGRTPEPELDRLSNILRAFNDQFGNIEWKDVDKISQVIAEEVPTKVALDKAYQNAMKHSDKQNARIEHDEALQRVLVELLSDHTELFKQFSDNPSFRTWLSDTIFGITYKSPGEVKVPP